MGRIVLREGNIAEETADAIVNAANTDLILGAGVAGAIAEKGGPGIQEECDAHGPVALGGAAVTGAGALDARFVIHAASMAPGARASEESVRAAMRRSLELASELGCRTVAVPAIGAGIAGVSIQRCAEVLIEEAQQHLNAGSSLEEIRFVLFGEPAFRVFEHVQDATRIAEQMKRLQHRESD